jgi:hypothetical protein
MTKGDTKKPPRYGPIRRSDDIVGSLGVAVRSFAKTIRGRSQRLDVKRGRVASLVLK